MSAPTAVHWVTLVYSFTELTLWIDSVPKLRCPDVMCVMRKTRFLLDWRLLVKKFSTNTGIQLDIFSVFPF